MVATTYLDKANQQKNLAYLQHCFMCVVKYFSQTANIFRGRPAMSSYLTGQTDNRDLDSEVGALVTN